MRKQWANANTVWFVRGAAVGIWLAYFGATVWAQAPATLGIPRGGRIVAPVLRPESTALTNSGEPASSDCSVCPRPTLGLPRNTSTVPTVRQQFPQGAEPSVLVDARDADALKPRALPCTGDTCHPNQSYNANETIVRGSVDEDYLRGVPSKSEASGIVRGGVDGAPWDWLSRTVQGSRIGEYCQWFHVNTAFQSDHAFDEFVSPVTNPFFFEDPRALTELRPVFIFQNTPKSNPLFAGGNIQMFALQARLALNDRFSIVMPKLGFIAFQPDAPSTLGDEIGFAEIVIGPKLTFWRDDALNIIAAFGVNFEIAAGSGDAFQNTGSGSVVPYLTFAKEMLDNLHVVAAIGYRAGLDSDRSDSFFLSLHADYEFYRRIYPFIELNWFHYTSGGKALVASFEGGDLFNFGSTGAAGEDILTLAVGARYKIFGSERYQIGSAFEFPLTKGKDILDWRWTIDFIWRY